MSNGFFVTSRSAPYVLSKRNEEGSYSYDADTIGVGMQKQAALQDLEKSYESTINKAYSSYLANQKTIAGTTMGQGYKEMYERAEQEALLAQQQEIATNISNAKAQLLTQEAQAQAAIQEQYATETANLDRVARSMSDYLGYVGSLEGGYNYLSQLSGIEVTDKTLAEDLYETLFTAQPTKYKDPEGKAGVSFSQWLHNQMKNTDEDIAFENWVFSTGLDEFKKSVGLYNPSTEEGRKYAEIEQARQDKRQEVIDKQTAEEQRKYQSTIKAISNNAQSIANNTEFSWDDSVTLFGATTFVDENNKWVKSNVSTLEKIYKEMGINTKYATEDLKAVASEMKTWFNDTGTHKANTQRAHFKSLLEAKIKARAGVK